eukprot:TRINITY_DN35452_c0_g1_i1.p1 TRINITY_DN35452_c0_g1~~TRINITY_DN35452_c0_g1_i1.p1  ORF type:complete len:591 (+),score=131.91 TRINITY_DN35452_c0_g1_i1:129-1901(+)
MAMLRLTSFLLLLRVASAATQKCTDEASCKVRMSEVTARLDDLRDEMRGKHSTLQALEEIRAGILTGRRVELPSAHRQHLEKGSPLISEVTFDARHRPVSTNVSRHFQNKMTIAPDMEVRLHAFLSLKRASPGAAKNAVPALLILIGAKSELAVYNLEGEALLTDFDLGHGDGRKVVFMELSPTQENHFVVTVDDQGGIRIHNLKIIAKREKKEEEEGAAAKDKVVRTMHVTANFSTAFTLSKSALAENRKLNCIIPVERGVQTFFVAGDSLGGISVFLRNGTLKGRARVTEDPGGVKGLQRAQGQSVLFYSSHAFGFFSPSQVDVQYPPCTGWNSPLYDLAMEVGHSQGRVLLALSDGDVLVYATQRGKSKACDLTLKFPHVSMLPYKLNSFRGHVMALSSPLDDAARKDEYLREIFFFNTAAMENGYGSSPSRAVTLQASFKPKQPEQLALFGSPSTGSSPGEKAKSNIAIRFKGEKGVDVYELTLRTPPPPKSHSPDGASGGSNGGWDMASMMNWFPKVGIFGIALVGVVLWNLRKVSGGESESFGDDFDEDAFKEKLRERKMKAKEDADIFGERRRKKNEDDDEED